MSCEACARAQAERTWVTPYRWKNANIQLCGCEEHLRELIAALNGRARAVELLEQARQAGEWVAFELRNQALELLKGGAALRHFREVELLARFHAVELAAAEVRDVFGERLRDTTGGMASIKALVDLVDGGSRG